MKQLIFLLAEENPDKATAIIVAVFILFSCREIAKQIGLTVRAIIAAVMSIVLLTLYCITKKLIGNDSAKDAYAAILPFFQYITSNEKGENGGAIKKKG